MKYLTNPLSRFATRVTGSRLRAAVCRYVAVWLVLAAVLSADTTAQQSAEAPRSGLINGAGAAFNAATAKSYVVNPDAGIVEVSDDRGGATRSVKVGARPVSIAIDSRNGRVYVVNAGDGTVSVLNGDTDEVVATVTVGDHPYSIASDSAAGRIYVTRTYSNRLMVIDTATNHVNSIEAGSPDLLVVDQKSHLVYLLSYEMGDLAILNGVTGAITRTSVGMHAWGMVINQKTGAVYIAKPGDGQVAVVESGSTAPSYVETGGFPCAIAVNEQTNMIYVADYSRSSVSAISGDRMQVVATVSVGARPEGLAVDADHNRVFAANTRALSVSVIDGAANRVVRTEPVSGAPYAIVVNSTTRKAHVALLGATGSASVSYQ